MSRFNLAGICVALLFLLLSINACVHTSKWQWISGAMDVSQFVESIPEQIDLYEASYEAHPFREVAFQRKLDKLSGSYLSADNKTAILSDKSATQAKLALVKSARSSIYLTVFLFMCDEGGQEFLEELAVAAKRGVDVRVLIDGSLWSLTYGGICPERYISSGIQVMRTPYSFLGFGESVRLHEKLFIVDGNVAITGGQNIGSAWADSTGTDENFRDTDVIVRGPVVNDIAYRFVHLWKMAQPTNHHLENYEALLEARSQEFLRSGSSGVQNYDKWLKDKEPKGLCRFVSQDPQLGNHRVFDVYAALAKNSQKQIAFHVPSLNGLGSKEQEQLMTTLIDTAKRRSVEVDVITNGPGFLHTKIINKPMGWLFGAYTLGQVYDSVLDTPINVYAYKYWLHSKVFSFDKLAIGIGSFNFDETGVDWIENTLICMDKNLANSANLLFRKDFLHSRLLPKASTRTQTALKAPLKSGMNNEAILASRNSGVE